MGAALTKSAHVYVDRYLYQNRRYKAAAVLHHMTLTALDADNDGGERARWYFEHPRVMGKLFSTSESPQVRQDSLTRELAYLSDLGVIAKMTHPVRRRSDGRRLRCWYLDEDAWPHLALSTGPIGDDVPSDPIRR